MPTQSTPTTNTKALSGTATHAAAVEQALHDRWVVILMDPDDCDWSPWPVVAKNKRGAIAQARRDWRDWCQIPGSANVLKVYQRSWIGEVV